MRVALVGAEIEENLSLRYIHAALENAGHAVSIFDFSRPEGTEQAVERVSAFAPDVVGLSLVFTHRAREFLNLANRLRASGFSGHITAGGHFASLNARRLLADVRAVDSVVHGDGEPGMVDLLSHLDRLRTVKGLTYRDGAGRIHSTPPRSALVDLDAFPPPSRPSVFPRYLGFPIANMLSSRGCTADCTFCSIRAFHGRQRGPAYRRHSVERVGSEIIDLYNEQGIRIFNFHDDNFLLPNTAGNLERLSALRQLLREARLGPIAIQIKARPDAITEPVLLLLKETGLFRVFVGIESAAQSTLQRLSRGVSEEQNRSALALLRRFEIHAAFNLLIFDPDTTFSEIRRNIEFIRSHADFPLNFCRVEVYAGTEIERQLRRARRLEGSYLGYDYKIADPRVELAYQIFRQVFAERNFTVGGLNHCAMRLDYLFHLLQRFHPDRAAAKLKRRVKHLTAELNRNNADLLEQISAFASSAGAADKRQAARFIESLISARRRFDESMARRMRILEAQIEAAAASVPVRRSRFLIRAAAAALALSVAAGQGCTRKETHMFEMAPPNLNQPEEKQETPGKQKTPPPAGRTEHGDM